MDDLSDIQTYLIQYLTDRINRQDNAITIPKFQYFQNNIVISLKQQSQLPYCYRE